MDPKIKRLTSWWYLFISEIDVDGLVLLTEIDVFPLNDKQRKLLRKNVNW